MIARSVCKSSFWIGMAAVAAIPLVPFVYRWLHPPAQPKIEPGVMGLLSFAVDLLGTLGDGMLMMVWMAGLSAVAVLASVIAFIAAWMARASRRAKWLCGLPALLVVSGYGLLLAIAA